MVERSGSRKIIVNNKTTKLFEITYSVMKCFHGSIEHNCEFMRKRKTIAKKKVTKTLSQDFSFIGDLKLQEICENIERLHPA